MRTSALGAASATRPPTASADLAGGFDFDTIRRNASHCDAITRESIEHEGESSRNGPIPTQNATNEHEDNASSDTDEGYITTSPERGEESTSTLDKEAEEMLSQIIRLASLPGEWLHFLESDDYTISRGETTAREAGHSDDAKDVLHYLFHKIKDLSVPQYHNTSVDYENIHVTSNAARNSRTHTAPEIWTPFCSLHKLFNEQDNLEFSRKAAKCNALWSDVVDKAPFLFETRRLAYAPRHWSFVVLFVNTCAPQPAVCQALSRANATHEWVYRDQVLNLIGRLCREVGGYKSHTVGDIVQIWDHLHKKLLKAYKNSEAPVTNVESTEVSLLTQRGSDESGRITKRKSPENFGQDREVRKRRAVLI
jgi:hypothetical protein